jgi:hypothetical protein
MVSRSGFKEVFVHALYSLFRLWQRMGRMGGAGQYQRMINPLLVSRLVKSRNNT